MRVKSAALTGKALDWAVDKAHGRYCLYPHAAYSTDQAQGGPIIDQKKIATWFHSEYKCWCAASIEWMDADVDSAEFLDAPEPFRGPTRLIAAMRCHVASELGDEVDVPDELMTASETAVRDPRRNCK